MSHQLPPHDPTVEAALVSAVVLGQFSVPDLVDLVQPAEFFGLSARRIVEACVSLELSGDPIEPTTIAGRLRATGRLEEIGGVKAIVELVDSTPAIAHPREYARTVHELHQRRAIIDACRIIAAEAYGDTGEHRDWLAHVERTILAAAADSSAESEVVDVSRALRDLTDELQERTKGRTPAKGSTGIWAVDSYLKGGLRGGKTYIVAGRPGMGKSAFGLKSALATARLGRQAIFFSLEVPNSENAVRLVSMLARIDNAIIDAESPTSEAFRGIATAQSIIGNKPLSFVSRPAITPSRVRSLSRQVFASASRKGIEPGLIVVDYLQLMRAEAEKGATRERQVSSCSAALKELSLELDVPVMVLSQINRSIEDRSNKDKRPQLSDLRESGAIEQDADCVMFPYRPAHYDKDLQGEVEDAEIIISKNRGGKPGNLNVKWRGANTEFLAIDYQAEDTRDDLNSVFGDES